MPPAQKLPSYNRVKRKRGRQWKYPWNEWLDGVNIWRLVQNKDPKKGQFQCKLKTMEHLARYQIVQRNKLRKAHGLPPLRFILHCEIDTDAKGRTVKECLVIEPQHQPPTEPSDV